MPRPHEEISGAEASPQLCAVEPLAFALLTTECLPGEAGDGGARG